MFHFIRLFMVCFGTIINFCPSNILAEYDQQPKIVTENGNLVVEAAVDRNITLRLTGDSSLFVNNVNIMERIRPRYNSDTVEDNGSKLKEEITSIDELKTEIQELQDDLERFANRMMITQNRTKRLLQLGVIRRNLGRINRLNGRLLVLERKLKKDECAEATEPCKNGGTCYDSYNGFYCECTEGYKGNTCEEDVDECYLYAGTDLGCQNNALCINTPGSYKCHCANGFSGTHCRLRNAVCHQGQFQELCGHGSCINANNKVGYTCLCEQGWKRNTTLLSNSTTSTSPACDVDVNECEETHHPCHSECINLPGSFKCGPCPKGYTGNGITCFDIDECATNNGGCSTLPKVRCINTEGSYICGNCPPGWIGDGRTCDLAPSNSCNDQHICHPQAKCEYISEVASCTCPPGMFGHGFGPIGCHTNPLTDSCENHICQNNGTCVSSGRTTSCICPSGYSGALCETADGCHPKPCQNGGSCKPLGVNGFKCSCLSGTTGKHCEVLRSVCAKTMRLPSGELKYPADDVTEYSFNERCAWIIRTTPTQILNVTFSKFDVEQSEDCTRDWLQIHDGNSLASQLIGRFCGTDLPLGGNILSSHHLLFFWFRSDNATNRAGFEMTWTSQPHICGENIEVTETEAGVIKSPGYPGKTPMNRECLWQLSAPYGQRFVLRIYEVNLGSLPNCTGDSLLVNDADLMLKKYCQSSKAEVFRSSANKISIHLHTDHFKSDSSFQLHYEVEPGLPHCGGIFTEPFGYIIGPSEQATCLYLIQQPPGTQIKWEFTDFTAFDIINCNLNSIEIFNGKTVEDPRIFITCGEQATEPVTSTSNNMMVRYKNSLVDETKGNNPLKAKYSRVCEYRVFGPDAGVLSTPNYPQAYLENITCTFRIYGPSDSVVLVNFTDFSIAESTTFSRDDGTNFINNNTEAIKFNDDSITYVDIFLSSTNKRRYYKGSPMVLRSERNVMTVVFQATTNTVKARGLRFDYQFEKIECGGVYTQPEGPIDRTTSGDICVIIFEALEARHVKLDLEVTAFEEVGEFLIYANQTDGRDLLLKNITKSAKIQETFSFNTITLLLKSRMKISGSYEFVNTPQACSGNYSTLYGIIISPSWPRPYPANLDCVWIITAPLGNKIELQMHNFTLEPTCSGDKLEIRNGMFPNSPLIGSYCANQIPSRLVSFTNSLYLRFTTDNYIEGSGFYFNWEQTMTGCGGKFNSYKGSIHTPHFDMQPEVMTQPDINLVCDWQIVVSQGSSIDLTVTTALDELEFCRKNNLKIYDGGTTLSQLISFNCSNILKGQHLKLMSSTNELLIVYSLTQESNHVTPEFIVDYVTNCKAIIDKYSGVIESPNFPENYPENQDCAWELKAGRNNKLQLMFSHLSVESLDMLCNYDYVEVWDMKDLDILKKHHLCVATAEPIVSEGNRLIIHFVTDYSNNRNGFRAEYSRLGCGQYMRRDFGHFTSPNYPYSNDLDCDWFIEVQPGKQIVLIVTEFHIEADSPDCKANFLTFKETKNSSIELAKECHEQQGPLKITSPGNRLLIHFHTTSTRSRKYFKASYYTRNSICGGTLTGSSGIITSANYPHSPTASSYNCIWDINVPESYGILLNFKHFQLGESPNCTDASMEFSTTSGVSAQYLGIFCGTEKPNIKLVHSNHLNLEYKDNGKQNLGIFAIEYKKQCGGPITKSSGYIKSLATEECIWEFDVSPGTLISLNILQMDCYCRQNSDGLKVCPNGLGFKENHFDYNLQAGNYTMYLCEQHQTDLVFEITKLHIFANNINFRAKYSTTQHSCGGHIKSPRGSLASPYYPSTYPPNIDCSWTLEASKGSFLQLQFHQLDIVKTELCNEDYLEIRDWSEGRVLGVYCGANKPQETLVSFERFWLRFHSAEGNTGNGFKVSWNYAHLNELVNMTKGYIESPPIKMVQNDEEPYAWRIITQRGAFIQIGFEEYNQGLKLFDGYDETALLVDIPPSPWRFVSSSNVAYLQTDNDNGNFEKFRLLWNITNNKPLDANATVSKCHAEEFINVHRYNAIRVSSPGYPSGYENGLSCDWIFKPVSVIEHVAVALIDVDLETTGNCASDYLKISTSVDLITWQKREQLCNNSNSKVDKSGIFQWVKETSFLWVHGTPHVKLDFVTDMSINGTGFLAKVVAKCGSNMTDSVGFIAGNRFTDFYDGPNSQCIWHVNVKPSKRIRVQLDYPKLTLDKQNFNTECSTHALIYDGIDDHAPLLMPGKLCYPQNTTTIILNSTTNHLTIKYNLNLAETRPQLMMFWNLTYREYSECSEEIRLIPEAPEVIVTSPAYPNVPQPHTECNWLIVAPQGELIEIKFIDRFDMNPRYCAQEYIELFDGSTPLSHKLGRYCHKPKPLKTTQNMLYMNYLTDIAEPRSGFKAAISISKCGGLFTENHGVITSPNYPASYPSSSQCDYIIHLYSKSLLSITILDMHLPYNETSLQTSDHLEIFTITSPEMNIPPTIVYGNATQKTKLQFTSNKIIVRFHTFLKAYNYRGFKLDYFADTSYCSHIVTGVSGEITMYLPVKSHYKNTCTWKITVPKNQRVRLEFLNMADIKQQIPQTPLLFSIYNNFDATSEITAFTSSNFNASAVIQSSDNLIYLRIMMPKSDLILTPLKARYSSEDESPCPQDITTDNNAGSIDLPGSNPVFQKNFYCGIKIKLSGSETIVFNISKLSSTGYGIMDMLQYPLIFKDNYGSIRYRNNLTNYLHAQSQTTGAVLIAQNALSRIQKLKMSYRKYACGGVISIPAGGEIKYPEINSLDNDKQITCVWSLLKPFLLYTDEKNNEFRLIGNLSFTQSCENEYLEIIEGQWSNRTAALKICRDKNNNQNSLEYLIKRNIIVTYNSLVFDSEKPSFTLKIKRNLICSSETMVNSLSSTIKIDQSSYKNNQECSWIFYTTPGLYLQVKFLGRFFIESSANCSKDYLEFQKNNGGLWMPEARFCGRETPGLYNSSSSRLQIVFRTDDAVTADGFQFVVKTHCRLVVNITSTQPQVIESPYNHFERWRNMQCEYIFQSNETTKLMVVKTRFETGMMLYGRDLCRFGTLKVIKRYENGTDQPAISHCELEFEERAYQYLQFSYNSYVPLRFTLEYGYDTCGGNVTNPTVIRALKHELENSYADNMNCIWYITAPPDHSIAVRFKYFSSEEVYDHLTIYSGALIKAEKLVARLSGNYTATAPIVVDSNQAVIKAVSDSNTSGRGFEAHIIFTANCNERLTLTEGNSPVTLTRYIKFNSSEEYICNYRITAPTSYRIRIEIKKLQINSANSTCQDSLQNCSANCNFLEISDNSMGYQEGFFDKLCASSSINRTFVSSYDFALIRLSAHKPGQYSLEIMLRMEKTACGLTEYKLGENEKYKFTYPLNGLDKYESNVHCKWRLRASHELQFHFNYIDLQNKSQVTGKCVDYIHLKDLYYSHHLCGHSENFTINTINFANNKIALTFHSDESIEGKGFEFIAQRADICNRTYNFLNKNIAYTGYGKEDLICNDTITVSDNYTLNFYISSLYLKNYDCTKLHFKITDLHTNKTLLDRCHNSYADVNLFTTTNAVRIEAANFNSINLDYAASDRNLTPGCGGTFTANKAQFCSPPYENRNFSECHWNIKIPSTSVKTIRFLDFNMGAITNCHLDNVKIIEVLPDGKEKLLETLCGPDVPEPLTSTSDHLIIISNKSPNFDGTGWTLSYDASNYEVNPTVYVNNYLE